MHVSSIPNHDCLVTLVQQGLGAERLETSRDFGADGGYGPYGGLSRDAGGNLYGTLNSGGVNQLGVVFKLDSWSVYTELYVFSGVYSDGWHPAGGVALDANGNLYGTTAVGGDRCGGGGSGCGTVFEITP
jgi:hypothetical protein